MLRHLHHGGRRVYILALALTIGSVTSAESDDSSEKSSWDSLLDEIEATETWLVEVAPVKEESSLLMLSSIGGGFGYSDNFLKRHNSESSLYYKLEGDLWFNWSKGSSTLTGLFFAEVLKYENNIDVSKEYLAFGLLSGTREIGAFNIGTDLKAVVAEQIFDASQDIDSVPVGTQIHQESAELDLFIEWLPGASDKLRLEIGARRSEFDIQNENFWEPSVALQWERHWPFAIYTRSKASYLKQFYDDDVFRDARGNDITDNNLELDIYKLVQKVSWTPAKWFKLNLYAGYSATREEYGDYEERDRTWITLSPNFDLKWGELIISARWLDIDYKWRWSDFLNPIPSRHIQRSLEAEFIKSLPWNLEMTVRAELLHNQAKHIEDTYSESRGEMIISWSY